MHVKKGGARHELYLRLDKPKKLATQPELTRQLIVRVTALLVDEPAEQQPEQLRPFMERVLDATEIVADDALEPAPAGAAVPRIRRPTPVTAGQMARPDRDAKAFAAASDALTSANHIELLKKYISSRTATLAGEQPEGDLLSTYTSAVRRIIVSLLQFSDYWRATHVHGKTTTPGGAPGYDELAEGAWRKDSGRRLDNHTRREKMDDNVKARAKALRQLDSNLTPAAAMALAKRECELPSAPENRQAAAERNALARWASSWLEKLRDLATTLLEPLKNWHPRDVEPGGTQRAAAAMLEGCGPLRVAAARANTPSTGLDEGGPLLGRLQKIKAASALGADFDAVKRCALAAVALTDDLAAACRGPALSASTAGPAAAANTSTTDEPPEVVAMARFVRELPWVVADLRVAFDGAEQRERDRHFELRGHWERQNSSCAAAGVCLTLSGGARGTDVAAWLSESNPLHKAVSLLPEHTIHTNERGLGDALAEALATTALPLNVAAAPAPAPGGGAKVVTCQNVNSSRLEAGVAEARDTVIRWLEYARTRAACPRGAAPMADMLKYHGSLRGPAGEAKAKVSAVKQHKQQCGHSELLALALLLATLAGAECGELHAEWSPNPRAPGLCLLIVVSRNCCRSCRYALPHLARLLKADVVVQCRRSSDGGLSKPIVFAYDAIPPPAQHAYVEPQPA